MKQIFTTLLILLSLFLSAYAQERMSIGILPFTYVPGSASVQDVNSIQETVTTGFTKTKRFVIVDRTKMDALKNEKELQKSEDFIDGKVVEQGKDLGADFLVSGHVISAVAQAQTSTDTKGKTTVSYVSKLVISLKIIDVATGQVIVSETLQPKSEGSLLSILGVGSSNPNQAISKAISDIEPKVDQFVSQNFPVMFSIAEIQEKDKSGGAIKILIAGGSGFGLKKGDKLKVIEIVEMNVDGKKMQRKKEVGELRVLNVEDENFSVCSVKTGGVELAAKFDSKEKLKVITEGR